MFFFIPVFLLYKDISYTPRLLADLLAISFGFSLLIFSVYILNDLLDLDSDSLHPVKKFRPLAAKEISQRQAIIATCILAASGLTFLYNDFIYIYCGMAYLLTNFIYSKYLKKNLIFSLICLSFFHVIRFFVGFHILGKSNYWGLVLLSFILFLPVSLVMHQKRFAAKYSNKTLKILYGLLSVCFLLALCFASFMTQAFSSSVFLITCLFATLFIVIWKIYEKDVLNDSKLAPLLQSRSAWLIVFSIGLTSFLSDSTYEFIRRLN